LKKPLSGKVSTPFSESPPGFVPQLKKIDLLYPVSVQKIVEMGFYPRRGFWGKLTQEMRNRTQEILKWLKLEEAVHKNFSELSGGMRQKVLIARALVMDSDVVIMDEPNTGLDEDSEKDLVKYLYRLWKEQGKTVIFILHDTYLLKGYDFPNYLELNKGKIKICSGKELK
jgi:ABC-type Mn2+/Zn2+ transport system ATPase subunit